MIILEDTRQQKKKHALKHEYFAAHGIEVMRSKLFVGDYTLPTDQSICIDTKKDIQELVCDLTKDHGRFVKEAEKAKRAGIKLIILVENAGGAVKKGSKIVNPVIRDFRDLHKWVNPRLCMFYKGKQKYPKATRGITLQKMVFSFAKNHGCEFVFCHPNEAGERIVDILSKSDCIL